MSEYRIFEAKDIDSAIEEACSYFDLERDQLEIEIEDGGSAGIFGLVGVKKARIKALPRRNSAELENMITSILGKLLNPITEDAVIRVQAQEDPIKVDIEDEENSGLIIGREGQTISALQYLLNRIVSNQWKERVRIQLDTGDYREQQKENLKNQTHYLADKAKKSGRVQSTKPMTSYHRRVVHMTLQDDDQIQTRSKGEGPLKRVLIIPKKGGPKRGQTQSLE